MILCRAVGLGASGRLYVGVNLEFARLPVNNSVHAEQFLVVNALHHEEQAITKMAVSAAPCGHCRQFYSELCCAVSLFIAMMHSLLCDNSGTVETCSIRPFNIELWLLSGGEQGCGFQVSSDAVHLLRQNLQQLP